MADPRLTTVQMRLAAGDANGARMLADAMLADSGLAMSDRFGALVLRSRAQEARGDLPNAIVDLEGALAIDATQARIWNELGLLSADAGMNERAMVAFDHATKSDPGYARAWNNLGNALRAAGRGAEAVRAVERAVATDTSYALAWSNLGALKRSASSQTSAAHWSRSPDSCGSEPIFRQPPSSSHVRASSTRAMPTPLFCWPARLPNTTT